MREERVPGASVCSGHSCPRGSAHLEVAERLDHEIVSSHHKNFCDYELFVTKEMCDHER